MRHLGIWLAVVGLSAAALGDDIVYEGLHYSGVQLVSADDFTIIFRSAQGNRITKRLDMVTSIQMAGQEKFNALARGCYERGMRVFDVADLYGTHPFLANALKQMPRKDYVIFSKIWWRPGGLPPGAGGGHGGGRE